MTSNPYGTCYCTKYEGAPPCVHSAYDRGVEDTRKTFEHRVTSAAKTFWDMIEYVTSTTPPVALHEARQVSEDVYICITCRTAWPCFAVQKETEH